MKVSIWFFARIYFYFFSFELIAQTKLTCETDCQKTCGLNLECRLRCESDKPSCLPEVFGKLNSLKAKHHSMQMRLMDEFVESEVHDFSYVVSRKNNHEAEHRGDSLLWTSLAAASVTCQEAQKFINSIAASVSQRNGALVRFDPLPVEYSNNATSRDQETGAIAGLAMVFKKCETLRPTIAALWQTHVRYIEKIGKLYDGDQEHYRITPGFKFLIDLASYIFFAAKHPDAQQKSLFETANVSTAVWTESSKATCYPIHLATLQLITADVLGSPVKMNTYRKFCDATIQSDLPLTDWYCKRVGENEVFNYLNRFDNENVNFPEFRYEYRHQRCGKRENPDLSPDLRSPAIDYLFFSYVTGYLQR